MLHLEKYPVKQQIFLSIASGDARFLILGAKMCGNMCYVATVQFLFYIFVLPKA